MSTASPARRTIAVILLIPAVVAFALWAFAWPAARLAPHDLPIGVAGPAASAAPLERHFEHRQGAFAVHRYADEAAARQAIEDRVVYGAVVTTPEGPKVLTASAASPVVAQLLRDSVAAGAPPGIRPATEDVVSTPAGDPRGGALASSVLPLALAGVAAGAMVTGLGLRGTRSVVALTGAAALVGVTATGLTDSWLGVLAGGWWAEAGAFTLATLAVGATVAGLAALLGPAGVGLGALLVVLLGNPFSGVATAPELLPEPAGLIGQWLPPGAGGSLLRSVAYFDGGGAGGPALTLTLWAVLGLIAVLIGGRRRTTAPALTATRPSGPAPAG